MHRAEEHEWLHDYCCQSVCLSPTDLCRHCHLDYKGGKEGGQSNDLQTQRMGSLRFML